MQAHAPLPIRDDWTPDFLRPRDDANRDFAFNLADAEGAPKTPGSGQKVHAGVDWFAPAGTPICAPMPGKVFRAETSIDHVGPVFGGVMAIEDATGMCWVMRHVQPALKVGAVVEAGQAVAEVFDWHSGGDHLHLEIWRSRAGGYVQSNMIDPEGVDWLEAAQALILQPAVFYFEEMPAAEGGTGPDAVGVYATGTGAKRAVTLRTRRGEDCTAMHAEDGRHHVLRWPDGNDGRIFRFGPWVKKEERDKVAAAREENVGHVVRRFNGRAFSIYPWPREA